MAGAGTLSALILAAVLVWAAAAKLTRRVATIEGFRALGLPAPAGLALAVPLAELATAGLLVGRPGLGGVVALGLLAAFTVVLVAALWRGVDAGCGCFGSRSAEPVAPADVLRNGMLAALAALATGAARPTRPDWAAALGVVGAVAGGAVLLAGVRHRTG